MRTDTLRDGDVASPGIIYHGDCFDLFPNIADASVDLILTDPPYGIAFQSNMPREGFGKAKLANDGWDDWLKMLRPLCRNFERILSPGSVLVLFCGGGGPKASMARMWLELESHLEVENVLVWDRLDIGLGWRYRPQWEAVFIAVKGERRVWNGPLNRSNVLRFPRIIPKAGEHPTPKPLELIETLILDNSNEGDLVLDPFCGGGPVPLACEMLKRRWIACELDADYHAMASSRVKAEVDQFKMF